jgi:hypothetical protein
VRDGLPRWLLAVVALNSTASLVAVALWAFFPCRGNAARCPPAPGPAGEAARPAVAAQAAPQRRLPLPVRQPAAPRAGGVAGEAPPAAVRMPTKRAARSASAATTALADRLHLNPEVLAEHLCDEDGELPKGVAARLERGFDAGRSLAKRLNADDGRTQSLVALMTDYTVSVLVEERKAAPNPPDRARIDELQSELVDAVRTTCGDTAAEAVKNELAGL